MIGLWFGDHGNALRYFGESRAQDLRPFSAKLISKIPHIISSVTEW